MSKTTNESPMTQLEAGETLDHYRIDAVVAHSGMSTLYRATDLNDGSQVASRFRIRRWRPTRFCWSASSASKRSARLLDHPGVVKTFNGEQRSRLYMVIEWVERRLLRTILNEEKRLPIERAVKITLGICDALDYMHKRGIVHRDLKPENVMVDDRRQHQADRLRHCHEGRCATPDLCESVGRCWARPTTSRQSR